MKAWSRGRAYVSVLSLLRRAESYEVKESLSTTRKATNHGYTALNNTCAIANI
jgi:hypothetical protein